RPTRQASARLLAEVDVGQAAVPEALVQLGERRPQRVDVVRRGDQPGPGLADERRRGPVLRHGGQDRPADGEVLEHLAGQHPLAPAARLRDQQQQRLRVALQRERRRARRVGDQLQPVAEAEALRPLAVGGAEVADEARDHVEPRVVQRLQERARVALAEEAARVRDPEPARRPVLEPGHVVEVAAVRDRHHRPARPERARLLRDRLRHARDRVRLPRDEPGDRLVHALLRADGGALRPAMGVGDERVAQVGEPARAGRLAHRRADEVDGGRRRGRDDGVDALAAGDPDGGRDRRQVPAHVLVGDEQAAGGEPRLRRQPRQPLAAVQLLGRLAAARPEVAGPVHPGLRRGPQVVVAVDPPGVVGRQHVRLDAERGQVLRQLERPLHAAPSRRGEVERDEQDLHAGDRTRGTPPYTRAVRILETPRGARAPSAAPPTAGAVPRALAALAQLPAAAVAGVFCAAALLAASVVPYRQWDAMAFGTWSRLIGETGDLFPDGVTTTALARPLFYVEQGLAWRVLGYHLWLGRWLSACFGIAFLAAVAVLAGQLVGGPARGLVRPIAVASAVASSVLATFFLAGMTDVPVAAAAAATAAALWSGLRPGVRLP